MFNVLTITNMATVYNFEVMYKKLYEKRICRRVRVNGSLIE